MVGIARIQGACPLNLIKLCEKRYVENQRWLGVSHILLLQTMLKSINFYRCFT